MIGEGVVFHSLTLTSLRKYVTDIVNHVDSGL